MGYVSNWADLPEVQVLTNNFRKSIAGLKGGINRIRWVHPTKTPGHKHEDSEQIIIVLEGRVLFFIDGDDFTLEKDDICVIPISALHYGESIGGDAMFYEFFAPVRIQNLIGFLGKTF